MLACTPPATDDLVTQSVTDERGQELIMVFDNAQDLVVIEFGGETAELTSKRPASGIWYANDRYELRGKGDFYELTKNGEVVFRHGNL